MIWLLLTLRRCYYSLHQPRKKKDFCNKAVETRLAWHPHCHTLCSPMQNTATIFRAAAWITISFLSFTQMYYKSHYTRCVSLQQQSEDMVATGHVLQSLSLCHVTFLCFPLVREHITFWLQYSPERYFNSTFWISDTRAMEWGRIRAFHRLTIGNKVYWMEQRKCLNLLWG